MKLLLIRVFGMFLIVYLFHFFIAFTSYSLLNNRDSLPVSDQSFFLVELLEYFYYFVITVFSIFYQMRIRMDNSLVKDNIGRYVLVSVVLTYLATFLLDPFHHNFGMNEIPKFEYDLDFSPDILYDALLFLVIAPVFEELFFRNLLFKPFIQKGKFLLGVLLTSLLFSLNHLFIVNLSFNFDPIVQVNYFVIGVLFALIRAKYGLVFSILSHIVFNLLAVGYADNVFNLYLMDYISSNSLYWGVYFSSVVVIVYASYSMFVTARWH